MPAQPYLSEVASAVLVLASGEERICVRLKRAYEDHVQRIVPEHLPLPLRDEFRVLLAELKALYPGTGPAPDLDEEKASHAALRLVAFYDRALRDDS